MQGDSTRPIIWTRYFFFVRRSDVILNMKSTHKWCITSISLKCKDCVGFTVTKNNHWLVTQQAVARLPRANHLYSLNLTLTLNVLLCYSAEMLESNNVITFNGLANSSSYHTFLLDEERSRLYVGAKGSYIFIQPG